MCRGSLLNLLEAASVSPTACHRLASIGFVFHSVAKGKATGSEQATAALLPKLVDVANRKDRGLHQLEDFVPYDARLEVRVRWGDELFRLLPGSLDQPVGVVGVLRMVANVIDPVLVERLGFGLEDAVELVLRRVDHVASVLAPAWSTREDTLWAPPSITNSELTAAEGLLSISDQVRSCRRPDRAQLALEYFSEEASGLAFDSSGGVAYLGATVAVRTKSDGYVAIPAGLLVDSLSELGEALAERACQFDSGVDQRWADKMERGVRYLLAGSGHLVAGQTMTSATGPLHWVVVYSPRQILVIDVVAGLQTSSLVRRMESSVASLDRIVSGGEFIADGSPLPISPDAEVLTLQVAAHPDKRPQLGSHPSIHLRGFLWLVRTSARDPQDLWYFLRDLADLNETTRLWSVDLIDAWEMWRSRAKSFSMGGKPVSGLLIASGWAEAEWSAAAESAAAERALLLLDLPHVSAWPIIDNTEDTAYVGDHNLHLIYQIVPWEVPVAVAMTDFRTPSLSMEQRDTVWGLATGILGKIRQMGESFIEAANATGIKALRIELVRDDGFSDAVFRIAHRDEPVVALGWNDYTVRVFHDDSIAGEALTGRVLAEVFDHPDAKRTFLAGWDEAPPWVRFDAVRFPIPSRQIPADRSHLSEVGSVRQRLGEYLAAKSIASGTYEGLEAKNLITEVLYPWALGELHRVIRSYSAEGLLELALTQLERANGERLMNQEQLATLRGFPAHPDPETDARGENRWTILELIKAISLILEETMAHPPTGDKAPDTLLWNEALAIAEVAYTFGLRSETLHLDLVRTTVTITDRFEVHVGQSTEPTDVDMDTYRRRRSVETLPDPVPINTSTVTDTDPATDRSGLLRERSPELVGIDDALRDELGFSLDTLRFVLGEAWAGAWDITPEQPFITTSVKDFADRVVKHMPETTREECMIAIRWLSLTPEDLRAEPQEYWETERRAVRVDTRPFIIHGHMLYVLPCTSSVTVAMLSTYLEDGRLPWPHRVLPEGVKQALDKYRQKRNDQLEDDCYNILLNLGLVVCKKIRPRKARRLGIDSLAGEIDVLCINAALSHIWVIEAKDPYIPFSVRRIRKLIADFHEPDGYVDTLLEKVEDIKRNIPSLTSALDIAQPAKEWDVRGLMVTRTINPAAFKSNNRVPFCTLDELADVIVAQERRGGDRG